MSKYPLSRRSCLAELIEIDILFRTRDRGQVRERTATEPPLRRDSAATPSVPSVPAQPVQSPLTLSGIAGRNTPEGIQRTAIISGDGQLYLVTEGELVAGRLRVMTVDSDAVTLKDENGIETRLVLH